MSPVVHLPKLVVVSRQKNEGRKENEKYDGSFPLDTQTNDRQGGGGGEGGVLVSHECHALCLVHHHHMIHIHGSQREREAEKSGSQCDESKQQLKSIVCE